MVTLGPERDPRGGLYPDLQRVLGDHPLIHRNGSFDLQRSYANTATLPVFRGLQDAHAPAVSLLMSTVEAAQRSARPG